MKRPGQRSIGTDVVNVLGICLAVCSGCADDDGPVRTPELLAETTSTIMSVAVADAVYVSTSNFTILKAAKQPGEPMVLVANEPGSSLSVAGDHVYWGNTLGSIDEDRYELGRVSTAGGTAQVLAADAYAQSYVVDGDTVYWTTYSDATPEAKVTIYSVSTSGGTPAVLTTGGLIELAGALAVDDDRIYVSTNKTFNSRILSFAKDGSDGVALTGDASGLGGLPYLAAHGDKLFFLAATGGGQYATTLKVVAKTGGEPVAFHQDSSRDDTFCTSMQGLAVDDDYIYVTCRAHTLAMLRRASVDDGSWSTLAAFPDAQQPDGQSHSPTRAVIDDTHVYFGLGSRLYRVAK